MISELTNTELGERVRSSPLWPILLEMEKEECCKKGFAAGVCNGNMRGPII